MLRCHGHETTWPFERPQVEQIDSIAAHPAAARAPGLRRMHGRAELPAAQGLRVTELRGERGPASQRRIDQLPGLVEGLQPSPPRPPHPPALPDQPPPPPA